MMSLRITLLALLPLTLSACTAASSTPTPRMPTDAEVEAYNARVAPQERIVCRRETPVGTNIPRRVCRLQRDITETSNLHRDELRRVLQ